MYRKRIRVEVKRTDYAATDLERTLEPKEPFASSVVRIIFPGKTAIPC